MSILLGIAVSVGISFLYAKNLGSNETSFEATEAKIAIVNKDDSVVATALVDHLKDTMEYVAFEGQQEAIDDALYFNELNYVLEIPQNFGEEFLSDKAEPKLTVQTKAGSFNQVYVDNIINHYLSTYQFYTKAFPQKSTEEISQLTLANVSEAGQINFDKNYGRLKKNLATAGVFNTLAYGLFMTIFSGIAVVNLAFNRDEIRRRNSCSPISKKRFSRQLLASSLLFAGIMWALFFTYAFLYTHLGFQLRAVYFLVNSLALTAMAISFSIFVTGLIKSSEIVSAVNNTFILGSAFIGGVFVPSEILPDIVNKVASFTPTYWFVRNNKLIGKSLQLDRTFLQEFQFNLFILIVFTLVFFVLAMLTKKERGGLKNSFYKQTLSQ